MSTVIHHTLVKNKTKSVRVLLPISYWSNRQMPSYTGITVHFISS